MVRGRTGSLESDLLDLTEMRENVKYTVDHLVQYLLYNTLSGIRQV